VCASPCKQDSDGTVRTAVQSFSVSRRSLPYVTRAEMLDSFQSDDSFLDEVVAMFLRRFPLLIEEIRAAFEARDVVAVARAAHSLADSIAYFDEGETCEAAKRIEQLTAPDLSGVPAALSELERRLGELSHYLNGEFAERRSAPAARRSRASRQT
jgi:HPt (histidine-containing phosphotransfer) domain-containing protein